MKKRVSLFMLFLFIFLVIIILVNYQFGIFENKKESKEIENNEKLSKNLMKGLGNLCSSEDECSDYCNENLFQCNEFCKENPSNELCIKYKDINMFKEPPTINKTLNESLYKSDFDKPDFDFNTKDFDVNNPIRFVKHNFIELDRIDKISKFRSGYGHDFSLGTGEDCRSMKHYFWVKEGQPGTSHNPPWMTVKYFSPVDGKILRIDYNQNDYGIEMRFSLKSDEYPQVYFEFFHVALDKSLKEGSNVKAGQYLDTIGDENAHGEIGVTIRTRYNSTLISFFEVIDNDVFEEYKKRGALSRKDFIISKEERDAKPLTCDNTWEERFNGVQGISGQSFWSWQLSNENWVDLN